MTEPNKYTPILCGDYEVLEAACMYQYDIEVKLHDKTVAAGMAMDLKIHNGAEYLELSGKNGAADASIRVDLIRSLRVRTHPSLFSEHTFTTVQHLANSQPTNF